MILGAASEWWQHWPLVLLYPPISTRFPYSGLTIAKDIVPHVSFARARTPSKTVLSTLPPFPSSPCNHNYLPYVPETFREPTIWPASVKIHFYLGINEQQWYSFLRKHLLLNFSLQEFNLKWRLSGKDVGRGVVRQEEPFGSFSIHVFQSPLTVMTDFTHIS